MGKIRRRKGIFIKGIFINLAAPWSLPDIYLPCTMGWPKGLFGSQSGSFGPKSRDRTLKAKVLLAAAAPALLPGRWPTPDEVECPQPWHWGREQNILPFPSTQEPPNNPIFSLFLLEVPHPSQLRGSGKAGCSVLLFQAKSVSVEERDVLCLSVPVDVPHGDSCPAWDISWPLQLLVGPGQGTNVALEHLHNEQSISVGSAELQQGSNAASPL